ncbi:hypothetical protein D3C85_1613600 [compost metagenome]
MGLVIDGRGRQHGQQTDGVDGGGHHGADPAVEPGQDRQDDPADRRQAEAHNVDPQVGQSLGARLVMLDHVEVVGGTNPARQGFQPHQHRS